MAEEAVGEVFAGTEHGIAVDVEVHLVHVQDGGACRHLQDLGQGRVGHHGAQVRQVQIGIDSAELLQEMEDGQLQVLDGVIALGQRLVQYVLAVDGGLPVGGAETGYPEDGGTFLYMQLGGNVGVGTIINRHVLNAQTRMDIEVEFLDMIRQSGHEPAVASVRVSDGTADKRIAAQLQIPEGTPIIRVSRLCTADGKPAIYCEDVIEKALAQGGYTINDLKLPIFHFLQQFCGVNPYLDLTDLRPVVADAALAEIFQVPMGSPLLNMDEVDFDIDGKPVFCSNEYFADGIFRHTVMRKKL